MWRTQPIPGRFTLAQYEEDMKPKPPNEADLISERFRFMRQIEALNAYEKAIDRKLAQKAENDPRIDPNAEKEYLQLKAIAEEEYRLVKWHRSVAQYNVDHINEILSKVFQPIVTGRSVSTAHERQLLREEYDKLTQLLTEPAFKQVIIKRVLQQIKIIDTLLMLLAKETEEAAADAVRYAAIENNPATSVKDRKAALAAQKRSERLVTEYLPERRRDLIAQKTNREEFLYKTYHYSRSPPNWNVIIFHPAIVGGD